MALHTKLKTGEDHLLNAIHYEKEHQSEKTPSDKDQDLQSQ
jgi:hypothetical protein